MHEAAGTALPSVTQQTNELSMSLLICLSASILLSLCERISIKGIGDWGTEKNIWAKMKVKFDVFHPEVFTEFIG
jgi:hypothetical protein